MRLLPVLPFRLDNSIINRTDIELRPKAHPTPVPPSPKPDAAIPAQFPEEPCGVWLIGYYYPNAPEMQLKYIPRIIDLIT